MATITPADMEIYRQTARRRKEAYEQWRRKRVEHGWALAKKAASLLRERFQADKVVVFGSLLRPGYFDERSDVDLAARGIPDKDYLRAVAAVTGLDSEITVDLIRMEEASPSLCKQVEEGVEI
ncbi:MAG: nucleotidyltransferase family protein [Desulfobacterales bacterium]